eukprot:CAMPEP_0184674756 /NCGR_PEP_ID=MMETSP0308-20130426/87416_1 /TAXON_ID=38269 /ORGANISM="Gloeochaete witrockiana, Strain SAG 46.84" /LENGTH=253 /DNA_ID=CAMNT_0027122401 /DNA_START=143 /DNA_END=905 /DNA_ORIENTATION=+
MKLLCSLLFLAAVALPLSYGDGSIKLTANTQSYLQVPPFLLGGDMTIESWVKLNGKQGSWARLFDFRESSDTSPSTQDILVAFSGIPERDLQAQVYIPGNVYQLHAAELKLPLNAGCTLLSQSGFIGKSNWVQDAFANINVDEFRIWSVLRSQDDILSFKDYKIRTAIAGLEVNYGFETSATALVDLSGHGRNAIGFNRPTFSSDKPVLKTGTPVASVHQPQPLCAGPEVATLIAQIKVLQAQLEARLQTCRG